MAYPEGQKAGVRCDALDGTSHGRMLRITGYDALLESDEGTGQREVLRGVGRRPGVKGGAARRRMKARLN